MKAWVFLILIALAGPVAAHPHTRVDQQVHFTVGEDEARVAIRIVPTARDQDITRQVLDIDGDGSIDEAEARVFRDVVLGALEVLWNGASVTPSAPAIRLSHLDTLTEGIGQIEITATLPVSEPMHTAQIDMLYDDLGESWFIQPFLLDGAFQTSVPAIQRFEDSNRIVLHIVD